MSDRELYLEDGLVKFKDDEETTGKRFDAIDKIGTATYDVVQDWLNNTQSSGYISGGLITATSPADGTIAISALTGFIKITDSEVAVTKSIDMAATTAVALTNNSTNYIYVWYDAGTPKFAVTTTRANIKETWMFTLGRVYRKDNETHIIQSGIDLPNDVRHCHERRIAVDGFRRASGGDVSESGNRYLATTEGVFYLGTNHATTAAKDTDNGDSFTRHYHTGGNWTSDVKDQIAEGGAGFYKYDDGSDLQNLSNNKYGVHWVYIHFDADIHVVVGRGDYTLAEAQAATVPAVPDIVGDFGTLAAKIILEEDGTNFIAVQSAYETFFPTNGSINHNDLGLIQGGAAGDYYHMTSVQHAIAIVNNYGKNMLENPTFESYNIDTNLPDFWALHDTPTLAIVADTLFPGRQGNQITITATGETIEGIKIAGGVANPLKVLPSTKYTFSVDYKVTAEDFAIVVIYSYAGAVAGTVHVNDATLASTDAVRVSYTFTTDADADNLSIFLQSKNDGDIVYFAHPKLEEGAIATPYIHPDRDRTCTRTEATNATPDPVIASRRNVHIITAIGEAFEIQEPTGDIRDGDVLILRILDDSTARALTYVAIFRGICAALPNTTVIDKLLEMGFEYDLAATKWNMLALAEEP